MFQIREETGIQIKYIRSIYKKYKLSTYKPSKLVKSTTKVCAECKMEKNIEDFNLDCGSRQIACSDCIKQYKYKQRKVREAKIQKYKHQNKKLEIELELL